MKFRPLTTYRGGLPHWRLDGVVSFVTWRLSKSQFDLSPPEKSAVLETIMYSENRDFLLYAYVIMNDHVHVLVQPNENKSLEKIIHSWKSYSARRLQADFRRLNRVWQREYFDRIVRNDEEFTEKSGYILNNPLRRWPEIERYDWVGWGQH